VVPEVDAEVPFRKMISKVPSRNSPPKLDEPGASVVVRAPNTNLRAEPVHEKKFPVPEWKLRPPEEKNCVVP